MKALLALAGALMVQLAAAASAPDAEAELRERLKPFGASCLVGDETCGGAPAAPAAVAAAPSGPRSGQQVYEAFCVACHAQGIAEAPLFQDAAQWASRLDKGMDALLRTSISGIGAMPPKGTCVSCSDDELLAAIRYVSGT